VDVFVSFLFFFPFFFFFFKCLVQKLDLFVEPKRVVKTVEFLKSRVRVDERRVEKVGGKKKRIATNATTEDGFWSFV
jgi:hypothetical protein